MGKTFHDDLRLELSLTAGGATSWHDLLLYLIARFAGEEEARHAAKVFLLQAHREGQLPFAGLSAGRQHEDKLIQEAQLWLAQSGLGASPVRFDVVSVLRPVSGAAVVEHVEGAF